MFYRIVGACAICVSLYVFFSWPRGPEIVGAFMALLLLSAAHLYLAPGRKRGASDAND